MELYLVQHAESKSKEEDPERGLSDTGFANIREMAGFIRNLDISVETIFHSDKLRAKQTAVELAKGIKQPGSQIDRTAARENKQESLQNSEFLNDNAAMYNALLEQRDDIAPMDNISSMKDEIQGSDKNLMIVGHLPFMDKLASALLCENENRNVVSFKNGCIVKLVRNTENKRWSIHWMISPEVC